VSLIEPEPVVEQVPGYESNRWNYPHCCADVDTALTVIRERIEEWDQAADPHGWWHQRPHLIALHNEVIRLRAAQ
jgi:hypothetical protein